jgi:hypothetical protein
LLTTTLSLGVQGLWWLAHAAYARLEPIRLGQVSQSHNIERHIYNLNLQIYMLLKQLAVVNADVLVLTIMQAHMMLMHKRAFDSAFKAIGCTLL